MGTSVMQRYTFCQHSHSSLSFYALCSVLSPRDNIHTASFIKPISWKSAIEITNVFAFLVKHCCLFIYKLHVNIFTLLNCGVYWSQASHSCACWSDKKKKQMFLEQMKIKSQWITGRESITNMLHK